MAQGFIVVRYSGNIYVYKLFLNVCKNVYKGFKGSVYIALLYN